MTIKNKNFFFFNLGYCNGTPLQYSPGKSHGWRSLVGCSPWGREESDTTERLPFHFSLSCIGEGNGNPLQCSCLENPKDGGAWWAAVYEVSQSRTRLKQLSSSSSIVTFTVDSPTERMDFCFIHALILLKMLETIRRTILIKLTIIVETRKW